MHARFRCLQYFDFQYLPVFMPQKAIEKDLLHLDFNLNPLQLSGLSEQLFLKNRLIRIAR